MGTARFWRAPAAAVPELAGLHGADLTVTGAGTRSQPERAGARGPRPAVAGRG